MSESKAAAMDLKDDRPHGAQIFVYQVHDEGMRLLGTEMFSHSFGDGCAP